MSLLDDIRADIGAVFEDTSLFLSDATLTRATGSGGWGEDMASVPRPCCKPSAMYCRTPSRVASAISTIRREPFSRAHASAAQCRRLNGMLDSEAERLT